MPETVLVQRDGPLAIIILNRPEVLNAINNALIAALTKALDLLARDETLRAAILIGAGERAFCSGMDLKERAGFADAELVAQRDTMTYMFAAIRHFPSPLIAAVNGYAVAGGLELALGCDFIYAATTASFGMPEVTRGIMPGGGATQLLGRRIGDARAREMIYTGAFISAGEALRIGLANRVLPPGELLPETTALARTIAENAPIGVRQSKRALSFDGSLEAGIAFEDEAYTRVLHSDDRREGYRAFVEKRDPRFGGR